MSDLAAFLRKGFTIGPNGDLNPPAPKRAATLPKAKENAPQEPLGAQKGIPSKLVLPYPPSANRYWRNFRGRTVLSEEARAYKSLIQDKVGEQPMLKGPLVIALLMYRPQKSGDLDNRIKVAIDSLQGVLFEDDKQIVEIHAYRRDDKNNPRVEVEIRPTEDC